MLKLIFTEYSKLNPPRMRLNNNQEALERMAKSRRHRNNTPKEPVPGRTGTMATDWISILKCLNNRVLAQHDFCLR
jgi:hypothetical protein